MITLCKKDRIYKEAVNLHYRFEAQIRKKQSEKKIDRQDDLPKPRLNNNARLNLIRAKVILGKIGKVEPPYDPTAGNWCVSQGSREGRRLGIGSRYIEKTIEDGFAIIDACGHCVATDECREFSVDYIRKHSMTIQKEFRLTTTALEMLGLKHLSKYEPFLILGK
jgi:hypothetical protein